jgi:superfamily II DNA helicase RecQ
VNNALKEGRQAIVFVSRVNDSNTPSGVSSATARSLRESLKKSGITDVAELHGSSGNKATDAMNAFQASKARVLITTLESGGTGINLDDTAGNKPRTVVMMTPPFSAVENVQAVGRVWRYNTKSQPQVKYLFSDMPVDKWNKQIISTKMQTLEANVKGEVGALKIPRFDSRDRVQALLERFDRAAGTAQKVKTQRTGKKCGGGFIAKGFICHKGGLSSYTQQLKEAKASGNKAEVAALKKAIINEASGRRSQLKDKQIKALREKVGKGGAGSQRIEAGSVGEMNPADIKVDPARFQYKRLSNASGEVGSLSGVKNYDPNLAGIMQVWRDPSDGSVSIVNGHNRLALAKRAGADKVAVRMLDVPNAKAARAVGALSNIAEGRGDSLDSAKFFRDSGISREDLEKKGIPMREKIATEGLSISRLEDSLYRRAMAGDMPVERAAIIGAANLAPEQQRSLAKLVDNRSKRNEITNSVLRELVDTARSSATQSQVTMTLFGAEEVKNSLALEKAQLQAGIKRRLAKEKKLFGTVGRATSAESLSRAGNQINVEGSKAVSDKAAIALNTFDRMKNLKGDVSDRINEAARRIADGESARTVEADLYKEILRNVA